MKDCVLYVNVSVKKTVVRNYQKVKSITSANMFFSCKQLKNIKQVNNNIMYAITLYNTIPNMYRSNAVHERFLTL